MWPNTQIAKFVVPQVATHGDDRLGLGYGLIKQRFHKPRLYDKTYPYIEPDDPALEETEVGEESQESVRTKVYDFPVVDPGDVKTSDPLYFVGAATKLSACFDRPNEILAEIINVARDGGVAPIPGLYGKGVDGGAVGGFSAWKAFDQGPYMRTGTSRGWAGVPPDSDVEAELEYEEEVGPEEFFDLEDLSRIQRLRLGECFFS